MNGYQGQVFLSFPHNFYAPADFIVIGQKKVVDPVLRLRLIKSGIAGNCDAVALRRDGAFRPEGAITVNDQTRGAAQYRRRIQQTRQPAANLAGADIPGDMPAQLVRRQAQAAVFGRYVGAGMIADDQHRGLSTIINDGEGILHNAGMFGVGVFRHHNLCLFYRIVQLVRRETPDPSSFRLRSPRSIVRF